MFLHTHCRFYCAVKKSSNMLFRSSCIECVRPDMLRCDSWRRTSNCRWWRHCRSTTATADGGLSRHTGLARRQRSCWQRQRLTRLHDCRWRGRWWRWHYGCSMLRRTWNAHHGDLVHRAVSRTGLHQNASSWRRTVSAEWCASSHALHHSTRIREFRI